MRGQMRALAMMTDTIVSLAQMSPQQQRRHFNPRPARTIQDGSATQAVLIALRRQQRNFMTRGQIQLMTGCTEKAISWAMIFLLDNGLVEAVPDLGRNSRYHKYRITSCGIVTVGLEGLR